MCAGSFSGSDGPARAATCRSELLRGAQQLLETVAQRGRRLHLIVSRAVQRVPKRTEVMECGRAGGAQLEMPAHLLRVSFGQFPVEIGVQLQERVETAILAHTVRG